MEILNQLEIYINAQKGVGFHGILFGSGMLLTAALFYYFGDSPLANGLRNGSLAIGILLFIMGFALRFTQENILKEKQALYQKDQVEFKDSEIERMSKVKSNYPVGQTIMVGLAVLTMVAFLLIKSPMWQGVSLAATIFFVGNIIIEAFSYLSITAYYDQLTK